jgi:hypothetical protein
VRDRSAVPFLCSAALVAAGVIPALLPMEIGGHSCDGSGLAVARRTLVVDAHDRECTHEARHELMLSSALVVTGLAVGAVTMRLARP